MAISALEKDRALENRELKQRRYTTRVRIDHNAVPANKVLKQDLKNVSFLRTAGQTATVDAIEDLSAYWTTPTDFGGASTSSGAADLGTAGSFVVLASSTITNTGATVLIGDLGLSPGTSVTGFPPGTVVGTQHITDAAAAQAKIDAQTAYTDLAGRTGAIDESGTDLGTLTLGPGVYKFTSSAQLTGTLTLDAGGNANAVWIFQIGSTLTTASASVVSIINGGSASNVFWQVGSSATLGTTTDFSGTIIAQASITANTGATVNGRLMALTGAVTLDTNADIQITGGSIFGMLVLGDPAISTNNIGNVDRIVPSAIVVDGLDGSAPTITPLACGGIQNGISPNGNLAFQISGGSNLGTTDVDVLVTVEYYLRD